METTAGKPACRKLLGTVPPEAGQLAAGYPTQLLVALLTDYLPIIA